MVDIKAEKDWLKLSRNEMRKITALIKTHEGLSYSYDLQDRLEKIGVYDGIMFHIYPIEDEINYPIISQKDGAKIITFRR